MKPQAWRADDISPKGSGLAQAGFCFADDSWYGSTPPRRLGEQPEARFTPGRANTWATFFSLAGKTKDLGECHSLWMYLRAAP